MPVDLDTVERLLPSDTPPLRKSRAAVLKVYPKAVCRRVPGGVFGPSFIVYAGDVLDKQLSPISSHPRSAWFFAATAVERRKVVPFSKTNPGRKKAPPPMCHPLAPKAGRGLCKVCYSAAWNAVKVGLVTWGELESLGRCRPLRTS